MTQEQLSAATGVDRSYLSELENGRSSPTVDVLFRLCEAMGVKASILLAKIETVGRTKKTKGAPRR